MARRSATSDAAQGSPGPSKGVDSAEYQQVYATEARTPNHAIAKVRPLADGRRLRAFLTTGKYRDELADARWVA
jgi:hypothetical protein